MADSGFCTAVVEDEGLEDDGNEEDKGLIEVEAGFVEVEAGGVGCVRRVVSTGGAIGTMGGGFVLLAVAGPLPFAQGGGGGTLTPLKRTTFLPFFFSCNFPSTFANSAWRMAIRV